MKGVLGKHVRMRTMADFTPRVIVDLCCELEESAPLLEQGAVLAIARIDPPGEALQGEVVKVETMADDTPRITVDMHCTITEIPTVFKKGVELAIARINMAPDGKRNTVPEPPKPKGGPLAKLAGQWCGNADFQAFMLHITRAEMIPSDLQGDKLAAYLVRQICAVESRVEIDSNERAEAQFHKRIREPYMAWSKKRNG